MIVSNPCGSLAEVTGFNKINDICSPCRRAFVLMGQADTGDNIGWYMDSWIITYLLSSLIWLMNSDY